MDSLFCQMPGLPHNMTGGVRDLAALIAIFRPAVLRRFPHLLSELLERSIRAAPKCLFRRSFQICIHPLFQRRFFFGLSHHDACSTRSDIFVVINWYNLPLRGKWSMNGTMVLPHLRSPCPKSTPEI